jgi:hypothetical protein
MANLYDTVRALHELLRSETDEQETLNDLRNVLCKWREEGQMPPGTAALPSGYCTALLIASENERMLESPIAAFLLLDDFLQAWVMQERGWRHFIGSRIGGPPQE